MSRRCHVSIRRNGSYTRMLPLACSTATTMGPCSGFDCTGKIITTMSASLAGGRSDTGTSCTHTPRIVPHVEQVKGLHTCSKGCSMLSMNRELLGMDSEWTVSWLSTINTLGTPSCFSLRSRAFLRCRRRSITRKLCGSNLPPTKCHYKPFADPPLNCSVSNINAWNAEAGNIHPSPSLEFRHGGCTCGGPCACLAPKRSACADVSVLNSSSFNTLYTCPVMHRSGARDGLTCSDGDLRQRNSLSSLNARCTHHPLTTCGCS